MGMWTVTAQYGNIDPTFNSAKLAFGAGATFISRETVLEPAKMEKVLVAGFKHKGYSFMEMLSNCHINLGRKNKMGDAVENLNWINEMTLPLKKYEELPDEEKHAKLPTGILKQYENPEYCESYDKVIEAAQNKTTVKL
jgi:2-oxoglutarate ferredoxin oxidoreductase subunit beta